MRRRHAGPCSPQPGRQTLTNYVRAVVIVAAVDAIGIGAALFALHVPLPLTILIFIGAFVPIIRATVSGLLAVLVTLAGSGTKTRC